MLLRLTLAAMLVASMLAPQMAQARGHRAAAIVQTGHVAMFNSESAAQSHCPSDVVVWLNTRTGIWHEKGMRWYGRTRDGAFVCRSEAAAAGYRDTKNGQ